MNRRRALMANGLAGLVAVWLAGAALVAPALAAPPSNLPSATPPAAPSAEAAAATRQFEALRDAARKGDGKALVASLSKDSLARLEAMRAAARRNGEADRRLSPAERLAAGGMRRALTPADLNRKGLDELAAHALSRRSALGAELDRAAIGPMQVKGERASAPLLADGQPTLFSADFIREAGQWKLDLGPSIKRGDLMLAGMAMMKGGSEDGVIAGILSRMESRLRSPG